MRDPLDMTVLQNLTGVDCRWRQPFRSAGKLVLGYLAMFVACLALIYALSSYTSCLLRQDDLDKDIGPLCFRAYLSILPVHTKCGGPGGAKVVTSYAGVVPGYVGSLGYDSAP